MTSVEWRPSEPSHGGLVCLGARLARTSHPPPRGGHGRDLAGRGCDIAPPTPIPPAPSPPQRSLPHSNRLSLRPTIALLPTGCSQRILDCGLHEVATGERDTAEQQQARLQIARRLVESGADPDNRQHGCGGTPLHHTLAGGYIELAKFLLTAKADVNAANRYGPPPSPALARTTAASTACLTPCAGGVAEPPSRARGCLQACTRCTFR